MCIRDSLYILLTHVRVTRDIHVKLTTIDSLASVNTRLTHENDSLSKEIIATQDTIYIIKNKYITINQKYDAQIIDYSIGLDTAKRLRVLSDNLSRAAERHSNRDN